MKWGDCAGKNGVHRHTCFALYRALLRQCSELPSTSGGNEPLSRIVRREFNRNRTFKSPTKTIHSLQAGYEALDIMHAAAHGDIDSISRINQLVRDIESRPKQKRNEAQIPTTPGLREKKRLENIAFQKQTIYRHPDAEPILSRPRRSVAGQRQVPKLVNARGIPFLRIKKPQPQNLSRIIRYKLRFKDKLIERRDRLLVETLFAKDEEDWERLITGQPLTEQVIYAHHHLPWVEGTWLESPLECYKKAYYDNIEFEKKQQALAEKLWEVVLAERKLASEEEARRKGTSHDFWRPPSLGFWGSLVQRFRAKLFA